MAAAVVSNTDVASVADLEALYNTPLPCDRIITLGDDEHGPALWAMTGVACISNKHIARRHNACDRCVAKMRDWNSRWPDGKEWVCGRCFKGYPSRAHTWQAVAL